MTEPTTAAGRRLLGHLSDCDRCRPFGDHVNAGGLVATIEAEARADERERLLQEPMMDSVRELVEAARAPLGAQVVELRAALDTALRRWRMYADDARDKVAPAIDASNDEEARRFRASSAALAADRGGLEEER